MSQIPTALVAGGAGFVGSHLCDRLIAEGHRVVCLDNLQTGGLDNIAQLRREPRFSFVEHDITKQLPPKLDAALVFNLACAASPPLYQLDPVHTMMTNVVGTNNLLALAAAREAKFLQASTSEVYGNPDVHPQPESYHGNVNPTGPRACYDEGKRAAETLCYDYLRAGKVDVRVIRIFNTYGPRLAASDGRVISNMIVQALAGDSITVYGDGSQTRSFCYVDDLVEGMLRLMRLAGAPAHPVNVGNPNERQIVEIATLIRRLVKSQSPVVFRPLPVDDPCRRRPDISKAAEVLSWRPEVALEDGLLRTIAWFREGQRPAAARPAWRPADEARFVAATTGAD